jgi:hypothetical protein
MVTTRIHRGLLVLAFAISLGCGTLTVARAQAPTPTPNGEFLCSAGPRDGQACNGDVDCSPGGVCVIAQGVCDGGTDDGFPCDCAAGTCTASTPACDPTPTLAGVCVGGPSDTVCCDVNTNCIDGAPCVGAQKVCLSGSSKGYSCLNDGQCTGSVCISTGKFCSGGDFDSFACVDNADCKNVDGTSVGVCIGAVLPTPTHTISTPPATRTPTATRPAGTGVPTATHTPTPPNGTIPPSDTPTPILNAPKLTRAIGATDLLIPVNDTSALPTSGIVQIDDEQLSYLHKNPHALNGIGRGVGGTNPTAHASGSSVFLISSPPPPTATSIVVPSTPYVSQIDSPYKAVGQGGGCALVGAHERLGNGWLSAVGLAYAVLRRRRKR